MLEPENFAQIRRAANGGSSILFTYPPEDEYLYLQKAKEDLMDRCEFISIADLFVQFIERDGWPSFKEHYKNFKVTPHLVFKSNEEEDFFNDIIQAIKKAAQTNKIPVLIRTGALYSTGIHNTIIMEHKVVMQLQQPLVIFYPARMKDKELFFPEF